VQRRLSVTTRVFAVMAIVAPAAFALSGCSPGADYPSLFPAIHDMPPPRTDTTMDADQVQQATEALIDEHVKKFEAWRTALEAGSIVSDLRERFHAQREALVREMLAERGGAGALTAEEQERISRVTTELVEKLLEQPTETLKRGPGMRGRTAGLEAIRHLFKLDGESE